MTDRILENAGLNPGQPIEIWYHGTSRRNATSIERTGFLPGTYFTTDLSSAIYFGGQWVFSVALNNSETSDSWQVCNAEHWPPSRIVRLTRYSMRERYTTATGKAVFEKFRADATIR